jgi:transposase
MATSPTTLTMAEQLVPDEVWAAIQPLLPAKRPHPKGGRPWVDDRAVLGGIVTCCAPACRGGCCRPASWAAAAG